MEKHTLYSVVAKDDGNIIRLRKGKYMVMCIFETRAEAAELIDDYKKEGIGNIPLAIERIVTINND